MTKKDRIGPWYALPGERKSTWRSRYFLAYVLCWAGFSVGLAIAAIVRREWADLAGDVAILAMWVLMLARIRGGYPPFPRPGEKKNTEQK